MAAAKKTTTKRKQATLEDRAVDAALRLIALAGWRETGLRDIAEEAAIGLDELRRDIEYPARRTSSTRGSTARSRYLG